MKFPNIKSVVLVAIYLLVIFIISSCANTTVLNTWKDAEYSNAPLKKVLVLTGLRQEINNKTLQDALVAQLKQNGVDAIAGYKAFDFAYQPTKDQIAQYAADNQVDAIMVSRLTGENEQSVYQPATTYYAPHVYYSHWDTYYPHMYGATGIATTFKFYYMETNIYNVSDKRLIWTAVTETLEPTNVGKEIQAFSEKIISTIKSSKLI